MKRIKLDNLLDMIFIKEECNSFVGFTVQENKDVLNNVYFTQKEEEKYIRFALSDLFVSETYVLECLLSDSIEKIEKNEIYEHGYPESRLIPSNFYQECQENYTASVIEELSEKIENILEGYYTSKECYWED